MINNLKTFKIRTSYAVVAWFMIAITYSSCYYDVEEELYDPACDTLNVTFSGTVSGIVVSYCQSCHITGIANGGVVLDTYAGIKAVVDDGRLLSSVKRDGVAKTMPPTPYEKISDCAIDQIEAWINQGAPNN